MNPETYDTTWDSSNDYSYGDLISFEDDNDAAAITKKIPAYANGELVWGEEPDGKKPAETTEPVVTTTAENTTETAPVTSTTTVTEASATGTVDATVLYGDVNLDGDVDLADAVLLNKAVAGSVTLNQQAALNADCNNDGKRSADDSMVLLKFLVHLIDALPE